MDYSQLFRFGGRRVLVIGAGSGIGREAALALAAHGAHVILADRNVFAAQATADLLAGDSSVIELDVLDFEAVQATAGELKDIAALVFTAAMNVRKRIVDYTMEEFDQVVNLNLKASFALIQAFAPRLAENGGGSIIGIASIRASVVEPGQSVYAATKAALVQLTRTAAAEFGPRGGARECDSPRAWWKPRSPLKSAQTKNGTTRMRPRVRWAVGPNRRKWPGPSCTSPRRLRALSPVRC